MKKTQWHGLVLFVTVACTQPIAHAVESGSSPISAGPEGYLTAVAPPPGVYWLGYTVNYRSTRLNDGQGNKLLPTTELKLDAAVMRMHYATAQPLLGGQLVWDVMVPYVDVGLNLNGSLTHKNGLGDVEWGPAVAYHHSPNLHSAVALHVQLPTGAYDPNSVLNIGHNYTTLMPIYAVSYVNPTGMNGDIKITGSRNTSNPDTHYRSGSEVVVDYALGYAVAPKWVVGLGGYARQQFTDDRGDGVAADGNRARAYALGPSFIYNNGQGFYVTAKYYVEHQVQNTWQGKALWLKATIPF